MKKQTLTVEMLRQALEKYYSLGKGDVGGLLIGVLLLAFGIWGIAGQGGIIVTVLGLACLCLGGYQLLHLITNVVKHKSRMEKIRQGKFYLTAQTVRKKKYNSDTDNDYPGYFNSGWIYMEGKNSYLVTDKEVYEITEVGDVAYCLCLEGEDIMGFEFYLQKLYEPDAQATALLR